MMLLDTCVVFEVMRPKPDGRVLEWFTRRNDQDLYLSVLTVGEIAKGCASLEPSARRRRLETWLADLQAQFAERVLPVDAPIARTWGRLACDFGRLGRTLPVVDGLLAATALQRDLMFATRNEHDFKIESLRVVNPWKVAEG